MQQIPTSDPRREALVFTSLSMLALLAACASPAASDTRATVVAATSQPIAVEPAAVRAAGAGAEDPALIRFRILQRWDAEIDSSAARAHLNARLALDEVIPLPYLGLDADPAAAGMRITQVYPLTGAESAGVAIGDLLKSIDGRPTTTKADMGAAVRAHGVGEIVALEMVRGGKDLRIDARLGNRPEEDEDEVEQFPGLIPETPQPATPVEFAFDADPTAACPAMLEQRLGGHGTPPSFVVRDGHGGRILRQESSDTTGIHYPMALVRDFRAKDLTGRIRFRFAAGRVDRAAGVVLRYQDDLNYLVARANAAEGDLRIFRVANGVRKTLPGGMIKVPCDDDQWHEIEFKAVGHELTATFDSTITMTTHDAWFLDGRVGVWTKSDSITEFDDLRYAAISN